MLEFLFKSSTHRLDLIVFILVFVSLIAVIALTLFFTVKALKEDNHVSK